MVELPPISSSEKVILREKHAIEGTIRLRPTSHTLDRAMHEGMRRDLQTMEREPGLGILGQRGGPGASARGC